MSAPATGLHGPDAAQCSGLRRCIENKPTLSAILTSSIQETNATYTQPIPHSQLHFEHRVVTASIAYNTAGNHNWGESKQLIQLKGPLPPPLPLSLVSFSRSPLPCLCSLFSPLPINNLFQIVFFVTCIHSHKHTYTHIHTHKHTHAHTHIHTHSHTYT